MLYRLMEHDVSVVRT